MSNGKDIIIHLIVALIKKMLNEIISNEIFWRQFHCTKMRQYFPKPYEPFGRDINVKVDFSNYATKADSKNARGIDTSKLAAKSDLVSLKAEVIKLDIDKSKSVPTNLSNLKRKIKY